MRQGIGSAMLYNIIIVFIVITFGFLAATLSYVKAFKVNGKIASALEKYEGYNTLSDQEITNQLTNIGYQVATTGTYQCPNRLHWSSKSKRLNSYPAVAALSRKNHRYCLYEYENYNGYYTFGIVTYVFMEVPLIGGQFRLPVYSESEAIFNFSA